MMLERYFKFILLVLITAFLSQKALSQPMCQDILQSSQVGLMASIKLVQEDLLAKQEKESLNMSEDRIHLKNWLAFRDLKMHPDVPWSKRMKQVSVSDLEKVHNELTSNQIIQKASQGGFDQPGVCIGYCFGRATFAHLALLKKGVERNSIKKIWIVGPMKAFGINWQFHVATIAKANDGKWYAVDSMFAAPVELNSWMDYFLPMSTDKKARIYITDAEKFSVSLGKYDRVQMGLDLEPSQDWYRGFFKEMMYWFQGKYDQ